LKGILSLWRDPEFVKILHEEKLDERPELAGDFAYETPPTP
jgi:hypothetical protein